MLLNILLQAQGQGSWTTAVMMGAMILVFYFFMIRPQSKKLKEQKNFVANMQKGDKIVTIGGIHGKINKMNDDDTLELETSPGSYMKIEKGTVSLEWTARVNKIAAK
jgi:preprotein translocase subunit YajC